MWLLFIITLGLTKSTLEADPTASRLGLFNRICDSLIKAMDLAERFCIEESSSESLLNKINYELRDIHPDLLQFNFFKTIIEDKFESGPDRILFGFIRVQVLNASTQQFHIKEYEMALEQYMSLHSHPNQSTDFDVIKYDFLTNLKLSFKDKCAHHSGYFYYMFLCSCLSVESARIIMHSHSDRQRCKGLKISEAIILLYKKLVDLTELPREFFPTGIVKTASELIASHWIPPIDIDALVKVFTEVMSLGDKSLSSSIRMNNPMPRDTLRSLSGSSSTSLKHERSSAPLKVRFTDSPEDTTFISQTEEDPCTFIDLPELFYMSPNRSNPKLHETLQEILGSGSSQGSLTDTD